MGKEFKAWEINGTEYAVGAEVTVTFDMSVTAVWKDLFYNVTFSDGKKDITSITVKHGDTVTLPAYSYNVPLGHEFIAWGINGTEYGVGTDIIVTADVMITSVWRLVLVPAYSVSVEQSQNGVVSITPEIATLGSTVTITADRKSVV